MKPAQLIMNGQPRAIEVKPGAEEGTWVVTKMGSPLGKRNDDRKVTVVMDDATMRKCEVLTEEGNVLLRVVPREK